MRYFRMVILITVLCQITSCIPIPMAVGNRGAIRQDALAFLENETVTREDVLIHLGMPEEIYQGGRVFDYKWITSWHYEYGIAAPGGGVAGGSMEEQKCNILRFYFDKNGTVEKTRRYSYEPDTLLHSNKSCHRNTTSLKDSMSN